MKHGIRLTASLNFIRCFQSKFFFKIDERDETSKAADITAGLVVIETSIEFRNRRGAFDSH